MEILQWLPNNPFLHWVFTWHFSKSMDHSQVSWFSAEMEPCEWFLKNTGFAEWDNKCSAFIS